MPKFLEDLVAKLKAKGKSDSNAWAIAPAALQKQGKLHKKRKKRKHYR